MKLLRIFADTLLGANISLSDMRHIPYEKTENELDFYKQTYNATGFWDSVTLQRYHTPDYPKLVVLEMQNSNKTLVRTLFYNDKKYTNFVAQVNANDLANLIEKVNNENFKKFHCIFVI